MLRLCRFPRNLVMPAVLAVVAGGLLVQAGSERLPPPPAQKPAGSGIDAQELRQAYDRAFKMASTVKGKVHRASVLPNWFKNNTQFWYRNDLRGGAKEFIVVDAERGKREPAFDHQKLADKLSK